MQKKNKKSFYTSVECRGNNILLRGYEDGEPISRKVKYEPYLFVPNKNGDWTSFEGRAKPQRLAKKEFDTIGEFRDYIKEYSSVSNMPLFGCENIVRQYISSEYPLEIDWDFDLIQTKFFDIETEVAPGGVNTDGNQRILLITVGDRLTKELICWSWQDAENYLDGIDTKKYKVELRVFDNESKMLRDFLVWWKSSRIDVFSGWNSELFDVPYLVNRIVNVLGEPASLFLSPWRHIKPRTVIDNGKERLTYDISGLVHLDLLDLYKKFVPGSQESWKLDYIAKMELDKGKAENPTESFKGFYSGDFDVEKKPIDEKDANFDIQRKAWLRTKIKQELDRRKK